MIQNWNDKVHAETYAQWERLNELFDPDYRWAFLFKLSSFSEHQFIKTISEEQDKINSLICNSWREMYPSQLTDFQEWDQHLGKVLAMWPRSLPWYKDKEILKRMCLRCFGWIDEGRVEKSQGQAKLCAICKKKAPPRRSQKYRQNHKDAFLKSQLKYLKTVLK